MNMLGLNLALAVAWAALTGEITLANLLVGSVLGFAALYVTRPLFPESERYFTRAFRCVRLILSFLYELVVSSIQVVADVLTPKHWATPAIIAIPLDIESDMQILVMTNYITLTPGTLSLDVSEDGKTLFIHAMYASDADEIRQSIKSGVETRVKEAMG